MALSSLFRFGLFSGQTCLISRIGNANALTTVTRCISSQDSFKYHDLSIQLTQHLQQKPDSNSLIFGKKFTDHMFEVEWSSDRGWGQPRVVPFHNLTLHPGATSLHYAIQLFEGMKAFRGEDDKIRLFRPGHNMQRMNTTAQRCALPQFDGDELIRCMAKLISVDREWVPYSTKCSLYMRPTLISTEPMIGVNRPDHALLYVILSPVGPYFQTGTFTPIQLYADTKHTRAWKGGVGFAKMGSNYAPSIMPLKEAMDKGCQQTLWLYEDDHKVTEVGTMNMFMFWENEQGVKELITPPLDGTILPGVTRQSLLDLARSWGEFQVSERSFNMGDLLKGLKENRVIEMFGAGTACVVCPIGKILYNDVVNDIPFSETGLAARFYKTLTDIQYGCSPSDWTYDINELIGTADSKEAIQV